VTIRSTILDQMQTIAKLQHKQLAPLTDGLSLLESGLDSLCLAILVANLDDELNLDPFGSGEGAEIPATVGEFIRLYETAAGHLQRAEPV
jgi:aryl carrier-like protein